MNQYPETFHSRRLGRPGWWWPFLLGALAPMALGAVTNAPAGGKTAISTNAPPAPKEKEPILSHFEADVEKGGRDPFFPNSVRRRRQEVARDGGTGEPRVSTSPIALPAVTGIIKGARNRRMVMLDDQSFFVGDKTKMVLGGAKHEVQCLEIRDDAVVVTVDGKRAEIPIAKE